MSTHRDRLSSLTHWLLGDVAVILINNFQTNVKDRYREHSLSGCEIGLM